MPRRKHAGFRKPRPIPIHSDRDPWSTKVRDIGKLIGRRAYAEALAQLDGVLALGGLSSVRQVEVLCFTADVAFAQGKFEQAAGIYAKATTLSQTGSGGWLRPSIGQVRALLCSVQVPDAQAVATQTVTVALSQWQVYQQALAQAQAVSAAGRPVTVPAQPPRPSVVAARFGRQFFEEGEPASATVLWQQALTIEPKGATKARIGLAELALREGRAADAEKLAAEAMSVGKFQRKTVGAWPILLQARLQLGEKPLNDDDLQWLNTVRRSVRSRALLLIAKTLRRQNNPLWKMLATSWLTDGAPKRLPIVDAEMQKLLLSEERRQIGSDPRGRMAAAIALNQTPGLTATETLAAVREQVRAGCALGSIPDWQSLVDRATADLGPSVRSRLMSGVARAFIQAGRNDLARPLYENVVRSSPPNRPGWRRAVWWLGRLDSEAGDYKSAAANFQSIARQQAVPERFMLLAKLEWAKNILKSGQLDADLTALPEMVSTLNGVSDYALLLDFARQLLFAPDAYAPLREQLFIRGDALAKKTLDSSTRPNETNGILSKWARRQKDFEKYADVTAFWEGMDATKKDWLWSANADFWEYLNVVYFCYVVTKRADSADALAHHYLDDSAVPSSAAPLRIGYAREQLEEGHVDAALNAFVRASTETPNYPGCAYAYYWFGVKCLSTLDVDGAVGWGLRVQGIPNLSTATRWQRFMLAAAKYFQLRGTFSATEFATLGLGEKDFIDAKRMIGDDLQVLL